MKLKKSFFIAVLFAIISLVCWESYWRLQGKYPNLNDDKALWSTQRVKAETATSDAVIILGSSRSFFDFQLDKFEEVTGKKPIQLSSTGSSPLPTFHDITENTDFNGTVIIGVTPGLFFSTTFPKAFPWKRPQAKVDYYKNRTYAQRINHQLFLYLQENLAFLSGDEEEWDDDIDLKSLLKRTRTSSRTQAEKAPPFYSFGDLNAERNMTMSQKATIDTAFANSIAEVWKFHGSHSPLPDKKATTAFFLKDFEKFTARGGNVILVRCPSSGGARAGENAVLPRTQFWEELIKETQAKSYHFEDYDQLKNLTCPEWSHLSKKDAQFFTTELTKIMIQDNAFLPLQNN